MDYCPECGSTTLQDEEEASSASSLVFERGGFKKEYFSELAKLETLNFWFRARNELILWALGKYASNAKNFLEVGCGTGYVLSGVASAFPQIQLSGSELFLDGLSYASERVPSANFMQMDARKMPFINEFDVIGAFDVLEHIEEDESVIEQLYRALKPGGILLVTVPQHPWLWSSADDYACHVRRYTSHELNQKILNNNFLVERSSSFVSLLLPAMLFSRRKILDKSVKHDPMAELKLPKLLNEFFYRIMRAESSIIKLGINMPLGGSRLIVARKV